LKPGAFKLWGSCIQKLYSPARWRHLDAAVEPPWPPPEELLPPAAAARAPSSSCAPSAAAAAAAVSLSPPCTFVFFPKGGGRGREGNDGDT
jgi:hypothetical protein